MSSGTGRIDFTFLILFTSWIDLMGVIDLISSIDLTGFIDFTSWIFFIGVMDSISSILSITSELSSSYLGSGRPLGSGISSSGTELSPLSCRRSNSSSSAESIKTPEGPPTCLSSSSSSFIDSSLRVATAVLASSPRPTHVSAS